MYHHVKKLMYTVNIGQPDPKFGKMLLEQFGGANGELAAATGESQYGETDFKGPWNSGNGLHAVQSEIKGGEGLDVTPTTRSPAQKRPPPSIQRPLASGRRV